MHSLIMIRPNPSLNNNDSDLLTTSDQHAERDSIRVTTSQFLVLPRQHQQQKRHCFPKNVTPLHPQSVDQSTKLLRHVSFDETVQVHHFDAQDSVLAGAMAAGDDPENSLVLPQPCTFTPLKTHIIVADISSLFVSSANRWETGCRAPPDDRIILPHRLVPTSSARKHTAAVVTTTTSTAIVSQHHLQ